MRICNIALKVCLSGLLLSAACFVKPAPAEAFWLVRGYPVHVGYRHQHYHHYRYARRILFGRNIRSGFFLPCAGTYGVPIC